MLSVVVWTSSFPMYPKHRLLAGDIDKILRDIISVDFPI